jgi:hypothetical protein
MRVLQSSNRPKRRLNTFLLLFQGLAFHNEALLLISSLRHTEITRKQKRIDLEGSIGNGGMAWPIILENVLAHPYNARAATNFTTQNSGLMAYIRLSPASIPRAVYIGSTVPEPLAGNM